MLRDLSWGVAIFGTSLFVVGMFCVGVGNYFGARIHSTAGRRLATWPFFGVGGLFFIATMLLILINLFGPLVSWLLSFLV